MKSQFKKFIITLAVIINCTSLLYAQGGPIVLMGIDAEDGGPGAHGPISVYDNVVQDILAQAKKCGNNGSRGILVIGAGKSATDDVTTFWNAISGSKTYVNGAANIAAQAFTGFKMIAVVSSGLQPGVVSGGLTQLENDALSTPAKQAEIQNFVNNENGGLLSFSQTGLSNPYGFLLNFGIFSFNFPPNISDITGTTEGQLLGIDNPAGNFDIIAWHDEYLTFPPFLEVLAFNPLDSAAVAVGGQCVIIEPELRYEYAAKVVCGIQNEPNNFRLARGLYATTVNIHNPNSNRADFFKKLAISYPPAEQKPGEIILLTPNGPDTLAYDEALKWDCHLRPRTPTHQQSPYWEGFLIIQSPVSLDVSAVYTTASLGEVKSIDVEQIRERKIDPKTRKKLSKRVRIVKDRKK